MVQGTFSHRHLAGWQCAGIAIFKPVAGEARHGKRQNPGKD
jgi:hypothetical protein